MLDVYKVIENTTVEGPGNRFCIWVQGCHKKCPGCWAKETWAFGCGKKYSVDEIFDLIKAQNNIEGVTFLGGEPFEQSDELLKLAKMVKSINLSVVCFTGYLYEDLKISKKQSVVELLKYIDLLIDGGFEQDKFDLSRPWVGSSNQRYIFLTDFYNANILEKYKNKIEMHIMPDGCLSINGMGDFAKLERSFCLQLGGNVVR